MVSIPVLHATTLGCLAFVLIGMTPADAADEGEASDETTLIRIVNGLGNREIRRVFISAVADTAWGPNRLEKGRGVEPGEAAEWPVEPGEYDLRVQDETGDTYTINNVNVSEGETAEWTVITDDLDTGETGKAGRSDEPEGEDSADPY